MAKTIPDRWIPYTPCGTVIEGTRIICFKVPLKKTVQRDLKTKWDIQALLKAIPNLGAVIDLTNTNRYYNPLELREADILYKKIFIPGRMIPPIEKVEEFFETLDAFLNENSGKLVGVHCTHGLNRTGYMVCRYMRDRLAVPPQQAIAQFEKARGYHIERENYIADLLGKSPPPPSLGPATDIRPISNGETSGKIEKNKRTRRRRRSSDVVENWRSRSPHDSNATTSSDHSKEFSKPVEKRRKRDSDYNNVNGYRNNYRYKGNRQYDTRDYNFSGRSRNSETSTSYYHNSYETTESWSSKRAKSRNSPIDDESSSSNDSYSFKYDY